jgi:hypothetical protein
MKNKAFTLIELLIIFAIIFIFIGITIPAYKEAKLNIKKRSEFNNTIKKSDIEVGSLVCLPTLNLTGTVNRVNYTLPATIDLLMVSTNGTPVILPNINVNLIRKINSTEKW